MKKFIDGLIKVDKRLTLTTNTNNIQYVNETLKCVDQWVGVALTALHCV